MAAVPYAGHSPFCSLPGGIRSPALAACCLPKTGAEQDIEYWGRGSANISEYPPGYTVRGTSSASNGCVRRRRGRVRLPWQAPLHTARHTAGGASNFKCTFRPLCRYRGPLATCCPAPPTAPPRVLVPSRAESLALWPRSCWRQVGAALV